MRVAIIFLAIMAVFCGLSSVESADCAFACTADYTPVCGVPRNGRGRPMTFSNSCQMKRFNCVNKKDYIVKRQGGC
ncbi:hypothetical protein AND_001299 [Anopheles darlingi]|uniref:Kazal-like domain-containing protein n=1 Tax=Anopheles darlingi TaxID=43151 RepID=W5JVP1_ANODA|nr:hypothetical protein AND_001299 [Anopheles darlingi]